MNKIPGISHLHTFGVPAYVLVPKLQAKCKIDKWKPQFKVGVYLGPSLSHGSSVHLVMSSMGLVSPQYHVTFDDYFNTVESSMKKLKSVWQAKSGLWPNMKNVWFYEEIAGTCTMPSTTNQTTTTSNQTTTTSNQTLATTPLKIMPHQAVKIQTIATTLP